MSKLLKEWNKLAFKKGNQSINEMYDDGLGNYEGEAGYSEMGDGGEGEAEVDEIFNDITTALDSGYIKLSPDGTVSYDSVVKACEDWYDGPQRSSMATAHRGFNIALGNGQVWKKTGTYSSEGKWYDDEDGKIEGWMAKR